VYPVVNKGSLPEEPRLGRVLGDDSGREMCKRIRRRLPPETFIFCLKRGIGGYSHKVPKNVKNSDDFTTNTATIAATMRPMPPFFITHAIFFVPGFSR
jgi:hypothetical protein